MSHEDGRIDYSKYSREELLEALETINSQRYPINFENLRAALELMGPAPEPKVPDFGFRDQLDGELTFSVGPRDHWRHLWPSLLFFVMLIVILPVYLAYRFGSDTVPSSLTYSIGAFLLIFWPHMVIHSHHASVNKGASLSIDGPSNEIRISNDATQLRIPLTDANELLVIKGVGAYWGLSMYPWQSYGYALIRYDDVTRVAVSSLLVPLESWEKFFVGCEVEKSIYPWPPELISVETDT